MQRLFACILSCLAVVSCKEETSFVPEDTSVITDPYGRQLILHGLNTSSSAKYGNYHPWIEESDVDREDKEFGFNVVRYLTSWVAIEPEQGVYNEDYLDQLEMRVKWYTSRGMYVLIDMHQDIYGAAVGGNGAPDWACITDGHEPIELPAGSPWWLKNIDPAAIAAMRNFWEYRRYQFLQDHYIMAWKKVAERFRDDPYVIGYDLMNEPFGGDPIQIFLTGQFETKELPGLYNRLIPALREVEPNKYLFFEPLPAPVTFGEATRLPRIEDTRSTPRLGYAPHQYAYDTHEGLGYSATAKQQTFKWEKERQKEVQRLGPLPLLCGEFGLSPNQEGFDRYFSDFHTIFDRNQWHWTYWSNDLGGWSPLNADRSETAILQHLVRTYPKATQGKISSFSYDPLSKVFNMTYTCNAAITQPTEIFIPNRHYPGGYNVTVSGSDAYTQTYDADRQLLKIQCKENKAFIQIEITPK